jgi:hypothetical protein
MALRPIPVVLALSLTAVHAWAQVPIGPEFHVNTYTTGDQAIAHVAADGAGNFVVVWTSFEQDGEGMGVFGQRFDASGAPVGLEFQVNTYTTSHQRIGGVAADPTGAFVVTWTSIAGDGDGRVILARRYDATGTPGLPFQVNSYTTGYQTNPALAVDPAGNFIVAWLSEGQDGDDWGIYAQRYDASANPQGGEFRVNSTTTGPQGNVAVAMDPSGNFVASWDTDYDTPSSQVRAQRYNAAGTALGGELVVTTPAGTSFNGYGSVAAAPNGGFVVVWTSYNYGGSQNGVFGRRYDASGAPAGGAFQVNTYTTNYQKSPRVAADADGNFVVVWRSFHNQDGHGGGAFGQRFDALGARAGSEFQLNSYTFEFQDNPTVAMDGAGNFVTVWASYDQEGPNNSGVYGQRFQADLIFRDGVQSGDMSRWSASNTGGGDLTVSGAAGMGSTSQGLQAVVNDTTGLFVEDATPNDEGRYRARFYFDPNGFDPGEALNHRRTRILLAFSESPTRRVAAVVLRRLGGNYAVMGRARQDDNSQADTGFFPISDGPHAIEIDLVRASDTEALDGTFELFIDGVSMIQLTGLDNSLAEVDFTRMGALSVKTGASGTMYWDEFESRRGTYIGLLP